MVVLPVVERELRVAARGRAAYRVRFYAVMVMLGLFIWCLKTSGLDPNSSQFGEEVTEYLVVPGFFFSLLIGVIATADCVSSEKRDGTLGLLFLTDLKGYDVICGKLAANSLNAVYGLLAILPVLGLPVMLGGVTFVQFVKLAIVLLSTLVLSLSVGICVSTYSRDERKAMFFTVLILLAATTVPFLLAIWLDPSGPSNLQRDWILLFSPGYGIWQTIRSLGPFTEFSYWLSILCQWLIAAALIARASAHVPHSWEESLKKPRVQFLKTTGRVKSRSQKGCAWLERNPFLWLALQGDEASPRNVWLFVLAIFAIWIIAALIYGMGVATYGETVTATIYVLHVPLEIWIAAEASRRFSEDRSNHTFETLLSTPLSERQIIQGQLLALFKQFARPIALVLVWETLMEIVRHNELTNPPWYAHGTMEYWPGMVLLVANAAALAWAGMWFGLKCKGRIRAILGSLSLVLIIPWVMTYMLVAVGPHRGMYIGARPYYGSDDEEHWRLMATLLPSLLMDFFIMVWVTSRLPRNFRQLALRR
jgi:ABC-type transport system involved in multi-copper enzyme maturation permease subunit